MPDLTPPPSAPTRGPVAILGAGLTGLTAAWHLTRAGQSCVVFDAAPALGGVIQTERHPAGWLIEAGPNSLQETPAVAALLHELGLTARRLPAAPAAKNRYVLRAGRLQALPISPPALLRSGFFSFGTKLRLLRELLVPPAAPLADLPLADFIRTHFGAELVNYALDPFISGIYAGDPARLSARYAFPTLWQGAQNHRSLLRAQRTQARAKRARGEPTSPPPIISFPTGLSELPHALAAALPPDRLRLNTPIRRATRTPAGWRLDAAPNETFTQLLVALPAPALAQLELGAPGTPTSLASLVHQAHPPVTALFLGYRRADVTHPLDGFGALLPFCEQVPLLGVLFSSTLFPNRAPAGHVALTVMLGGRRRPELAAQALEDQLALIRPHLAALLGVRGEPLFVRRTYWPHAIAQYELDHEQHLDVLRAAESRHSGLRFGGPVRDGIGLPACLAAGERLARAALQADAVA